MRMTIGKGKVNYFPNSLGGGCPMTAPENMGGFVHYMEKVEGHKVRERSESFKDHFSQATMFWHSITKPEQDRLVSALHFELGKVESYEVRHRMIHEIFNKVDHELARRAAEGIGVPPPERDEARPVGKRAPEVSVEHQKKPGIRTLKVAVLAADGFDHAALEQTRKALEAGGARTMVVSKFLGTLQGEGGEVKVDKSYVTTASVLFDAIFVPGGRASVDALKKHGDVLHFLSEAFKHGKPIGATGEAVELLREAKLAGVDLADGDGTVVESHGVVTVAGGSSVTDRVKDAVGLGDDTGIGGFTERFVAALAQHRHWGREMSPMVPA
jgi:catalase